MSRILRPVTRKILFAALLLGLLVAACGPAASPAETRSSAAQTASVATGNRADLRVQVVGLLEALSPNNATVGGMRLMINDATVMDDGLAPNQVVEAESVMGDDGLKAVAIHQAGANQPASLTFELTGQVESQTGDAWMVGGHPVQVPATAELTGAPRVGDLVTVQGSTDAAGALLAREVRTVAAGQAGDDGEVEFNGLVTSIGASEWVIGSRTVLVTPQTELKPGVGLGVLVKVHASPQADGRLVAREIEPAPAAQPTNAPATGTPAAQPTHDPAREQEWTGVLSAINGQVWTIGGINVRIIAATEVKGTLQVGDLLKVHARPGSDGVLVAREVEHANRDDDDDDNRPGEQEFTGVLSAINGQVWTIGGVAVRVTTGTEVKDTLQIGDTVKVHATAGSDGTLVAREVERAGAGDDGNSGSGGGDDNDDRDDDNSGPGSSDDDDDDDNSGHGGGNDDDGNDDNSGSGGGDDD